MKTIEWTQNDLEQMRLMGLTPDQVENQIAVFLKGTPYLTLDRPCRVGDGIIRWTPDILEKNIAVFERESVHRDFIKFVPASGAASRMVKTLIRAVKTGRPIRLTDVSAGLLPDPKENADLLDFITHIHQLACYPDLQQAMKRRGLDWETSIRQGDFSEALETLVSEEGLDYAHTPKGLIKFHSYPDGARTAFEEHLVEASGYAAGKNRICRLHFTVSQAHMEKFESLFHQVKAHYESRYQVHYDLSFSIQAKNTDTIAVGMDNQPFRLEDGRLLFRPGGHGALIGNLNGLNGDIVFIKNIDNVAHDRFKPEMYQWKKALAGHLIALQQALFDLLKKLHQAPMAENLIQETADFVQNHLHQPLPRGFHAMSVDRQKEALIRRLNRPLRVCGMVQNVGEPGGGPFWVRDENGETSLQIVETSQINMNDETQKNIFQNLTHFNPVDLVCGMRNWKGEAFNLFNYTDPNAVFIAQKSEQGRDLKALEHPGLWNGAMAHWNTVFVEVPRTTFNPVKQITDLLREAHMP